MIVSDVGSLTAQKKVLISSTFTCPDDPHPVYFRLEVGFGNISENGLYVFFTPVNRQITKRSITVVVLKNPTAPYVLKSATTKNVYCCAPNEEYGWENLLSLEGVGNVDWIIIFQIDYDGIPETDGYTNCVFGPANCICDHQLHHKTLTQNLLDLLNDPKDADVTLLVGNDQIKAHKAILSARSTHFRGLFESGMQESVTGKIELDDDPEIIKEVLKFLYSGILPENIDTIAMELLPVADKYALNELKQSCINVIRRQPTAENIVTIMLLADQHHCPDLIRFCAPFFQANVNKLKESDWAVLKKEPELLAKLLKLCSK